MAVTITDFDDVTTPDIVEAVRREWPFGDPDLYRDDRGCPQKLSFCGDGWLAAGETEEEFALRFSKAVWVANGDYCVVEVSAACLPYNHHCFDEDEYERILQVSRTDRPPLLAAAGVFPVRPLTNLDGTDTGAVIRQAGLGQVFDTDATRPSRRPTGYILYDVDTGDLATTTVYRDRQEAVEDADVRANVIVLALPLPQ